MSESRFVIPTGASRARSLSDILGERKSAQDSTGDNETQRLQNALNEAAARVAESPAMGSAVVCIPGGTTDITQIIWPDRVILEGDSFAATELRAAAGFAGDLFISPDFAAKTGQNKWQTADGVLSLIGMRRLRLNGNKAAQGRAGDGVKIIAKGLYFDEAAILDFPGNGLYTEAGSDAGVSGYREVGSGHTAFLQISGCGGHGWHMRGPHDCFAAKALIFSNGLDGLRMESTAAQYLASADFSMLHSYGNSGVNVRVIRSELRCTHLRAEDGMQEGIIFEDSKNCRFGILHLFDNCRTSGSYQGIVSAGSSHIGAADLVIRNVGRPAAGGWRQEGHFCRYAGDINGIGNGAGPSQGAGFDLIGNASHNRFDGIISGYSGAGGIALRTGNGGPARFNKIDATLQYSSTLWANDTLGVGNIYTINGDCAATQTRFAGLGPNVGVDKESWRVLLRDETPATTQYST